MKLSPRVLPGALNAQNRGACDWLVIKLMKVLLCVGSKLMYSAVFVHVEIYLYHYVVLKNFKANS